jgi:hypothetical protein
MNYQPPVKKNVPLHKKITCSMQRFELFLHLYKWKRIKTGMIPRLTKAR